MIVEKELTKKENACIAIGHFDGMHLGHLKLVDKVISIANERGLSSVIVSIANEGMVFTTEEEKSYLLKDKNLDYFVSTTCNDVGKIIETLGAKIIVTCQNDISIQQMLEYEVEVITISPVTYNGEMINHDLLEKAYKLNDYQQILNLCGHPYIMIGEVIHGKGNGHVFGFPTTNLKVSNNKVKPQAAVYGTKINYQQTSYLAVTNIGTRPTVDDSEEITIESFILDFDQMIYGDTLTLEIYEYVRDIQKFPSLVEVKQQIDKDVEKVKQDLIKEKA